MLFHINKFYNFFIAEKRLQWNLNTKIKYFMKVFHISWNAPETVFHEMLWKKSFLVYPCLYFSFQEQLRSDTAAQNLCGRVVVLQIPKKLTCGSFFCNDGCKTPLTRLHQVDLRERFRENNLAKVTLLKLLITENLFGCFH